MLPTVLPTMLSKRTSSATSGHLRRMRLFPQRRVWPLVLRLAHRAVTQDSTAERGRVGTMLVDAYLACKLSTVTRNLLMNVRANCGAWQRSEHLRGAPCLTGARATSVTSRGERHGKPERRPYAGISRRVLWVYVASIFAGVALIEGVAPSVQAQYSGQPLPYAERPLTLPAGTVRADGGVSYLSTDTPAGREGRTALLGTVAAGFTDNFELGAVLLPLQIAPDADYTDPTVYGMYRINQDVIEAAVWGSLMLPVEGDFQLTGGLPVLLRLGNVVRINSGAWLSLLFSDPTYVAFEVPLQLAVQASPRFFFGPEVGLCFGSTGRIAASPQTADTCTLAPARDMDELAIPLGLFAGYTIEGDSTLPKADLRAGFRTTDADNGFDQWLLYAAANFFFYL